jgi:predicted Fe-S protein YdhL (DUF1289 family)
MGALTPMRICMLLLLCALACSRAHIDRAEWQRMPREERVLYVQSLIAEERAKSAKGGRGRAVVREADDYVNAIDAAYAKGEQREPARLFAELTPPAPVSS